MDGGGSSTTVQNNIPEPSAEERELTRLNAELAKRQLANIDALAPYNQRLLETGISELDQNRALRESYLKAFPVEEQAALARRQADLQSQSLELSKQDFAQRQKELDLYAKSYDENAALTKSYNDQQLQLGKANLDLLKRQIEQGNELAPIQKEVALAQLEQLKNGGEATTEQLRAISEATQAGIELGAGDIDVQTRRGIGLIADELANSRGLRLTDTPIAREATLLTRNADDAKAGFVRSMRANEANAKLNFPLAVQGVTNQTMTNQQSITAAAQSFQEQLRNSARANRLALTGSNSVGSGIGLSSGYSPVSYMGQAGGIGLGLASISAGTGALDAMTRARMGSGTSTQTTEREIGIGELMLGAMGGAGRMAPFTRG
jgi:hypothetical protein